MKAFPTCEICGAPVPDYVPEYCCSGYECGCMGMPIDPCICTQRCYDAILDGIGRDRQGGTSVSALRAFLVTIDDMPSVCFGRARTQAKWRSVASWREAGFGERQRWPKKITAVRAPQYDSFPMAERKAAWTVEYVESCLVDAGVGA